MTRVVALPGGRTASYEIIGTGRLALIFAGGPGFSAAYMGRRGMAALDGPGRVWRPYEMFV